MTTRFPYKQGEYHCLRCGQAVLPGVPHDCPIPRPPSPATPGTIEEFTGLGAREEHTDIWIPQLDLARTRRTARRARILVGALLVALAALMTYVGHALYWE